MQRHHGDKMEFWGQVMQLSSLVLFRKGVFTLSPLLPKMMCSDRWRSIKGQRQRQVPVMVNAHCQLGRI